MDEDGEIEIDVLKRRIEILTTKCQVFFQETKDSKEEATFSWSVLKFLSDGWYAFHTAPLTEGEKDTVLRWVRTNVIQPDRTWCYREEPDNRMSFIFAFRHASDCAKAKLMFPND